MDPNTTFQDFKLAIAEGRLQDAMTHAADLMEWLDKGGFEPSDPEYHREWIAAYC